MAQGSECQDACCLQQYDNCLPPQHDRSKLHIHPLKCISVLLQEYEKRLLAKDHEVKAAQMQIEHLRSEVLEAKRVMAEGSNLLPAPEPTAGEHGAAWRPLQGWKVVMVDFGVAAYVQDHCRCAQCSVKAHSRGEHGRRV